MIELIDVSIKSNPFIIKKIGDGVDLTTGLSDYNNHPSDGGLTVVPTLKISNIEEGNIMISQICTHHILEIYNDENQSFIFNTEGKNYKDTNGKYGDCYEKYTIQSTAKNNPNNLTFRFFDAPHRQLCHNWVNVNFIINFETWFQFEGKNNKITPIFSFKWFLEAKVSKKDNIYFFDNNKYSDESEVERSIIKYNASDAPLVIAELPNLKCTVKQYLESKKDEGLIEGCC